MLTRLIQESAPSRVVPPKRRGMSMVFQSYAIWPNMTVGQNVAFGLQVRKLRGAVSFSVRPGSIALHDRFGDAGECQGGVARDGGALQGSCSGGHGVARNRPTPHRPHSDTNRTN